LVGLLEIGRRSKAVRKLIVNGVPRDESCLTETPACKLAKTVVRTRGCAP